MTILDISAKRLSVLEEVFGSQIQTLMSNSFNIEASVRDADVVIGAILIPGAVARTSTIALTNVTLPYIEALAGKGFAQAISEDEGLRQGVTTYQGYLTSLPVAQGLNRDYTDINDLV